MTAGLGGATEEGEQEEEDVEVDAQVGVHAAAAAFHGVEGGVVLEGGRGARRRLRLPVAEVQQGAHAAQNEHGAELVETHKRAPQPTFVPPIKAASPTSIPVYEPPHTNVRLITVMLNGFVHNIHFA